MAEKDKRSRALLRNLRKQARKGTLSSRERKTLLDQESKFRKARRGTAKGVGLGLAAGAAGLLSSPAAQRALGTAAGRFKSARDASKAESDAKRAKEDQEKAMEEMENATKTGDNDQAVAERVMGGEKKVDTIVPASDVDFSDIPSERKLQRERMQEEKDEERLDSRLEKRGGFDPRTGEYVDSAKQMAADEAFDRKFDESLPDEEVMALAQRMNKDRADREDAAKQAKIDRYEDAAKQAKMVDTPQVLLPDMPTASFTTPSFDERVNRSLQDLYIERLDPGFEGLTGPTDTDYTGGFKTTGERPAFDASMLERQGPRAVEGREMTDPNRPVMTRQGLTLGDMIAMGGPGAETVREERDREFRRREADYEREQRRNFDRDFPGSVPLRQDGPRVQAQGGKVSQADKLRKMIAKKYGIR